MPSGNSPTTARCPMPDDVCADCGYRCAELTPYERGALTAEMGLPGPPFPTPDSSWSERLYARGWSDAMGRKEQPS